jgi:hypothetical protein
VRDETGAQTDAAAPVDPHSNEVEAEKGLTRKRQNEEGIDFVTSTSSADELTEAGDNDKVN